MFPDCRTRAPSNLTSFDSVFSIRYQNRTYDRRCMKSSLVNAIFRRSVNRHITFRTPAFNYKPRPVIPRRLSNSSRISASQDQSTSLLSSLKAHHGSMQWKRSFVCVSLASSTDSVFDSSSLSRSFRASDSCLQFLRSQTRWSNSSPHRLDFAAQKDLEIAHFLPFERFHRPDSARHSDWRIYRHRCESGKDQGPDGIAGDRERDLGQRYS